MDNVSQMSTAADLELRAARIADPGIDLKTKLNVACELREMLETVRDVESARVLPHMIPALLEILRSGEPQFHKDSTDYQFRRVLLDILHRIPLNDAIRLQALPLFQGMLYLLRHDNEENGVICCKVISDILRTFRALTEELVSEFMAIFQDVLRNMKGVVDELLSENSTVLDSNAFLPSIRSFKVLAEMGMLVMHFSQSHRALMVPAIQTTLPLNFEVLALESPAQKKAREDFEAMGNYWTGMASTIVNTHAYTDFLNAQIKMVTFLTYVVRALGESNDSYGDVLALSSLRILQDCPTNAIGARRELMLAFRHLVVSPYRRALLPHIDKLFNEHVLLGTGVGSRETLRHSSYAVFADLVHYLRHDLTPVQLARIAQVYSRLIHNPHLPTSFHTLFAKMMFSLIEPVVLKDTPAGTARVLRAMLETCVSKLEAMNIVREELLGRIEAVKNGQKDDNEIALIEKSRPVAYAAYAVDKPEDAIQETRLLFRTFLHGFRACLTGLRKVDAPIPDGTIIFRLLEGCIRCMALFDQEPREASEAMDWFCGAFFEVDLRVFQEVWTHRIEFFFDAVQKRLPLLHICQIIFGRELFSPTLVAIVLKFLVGKLPLLGDYDDQSTIATVRLFKMAFNAVTMFPATNEPILASYLGTIIMDCFPLAAKASKPNNYFHLLRCLFRAIGVGGGRFELLYKEVLPLLPEMLENMNRQLRVSEGLSRDMIVELCLTVPLRLTHLLPHLSYLMQPLALALRGSPELVAQGLRTLELCIDNLTPDFLDPTLNTVLRELTEALHSHLKPLPANHHHAHTTIRILGKLGGRNRRLLNKEPALKYKKEIYPATITISFGGISERIEVAPLIQLASQTLSKGSLPCRTQAYQFMENFINHLLVEGVKEHETEIFTTALRSFFDTVYMSEFGDQAETFILKVSSFIFDSEILRAGNPELTIRRFPSPAFLAYMEAFPVALARANANEKSKGRELVTTILKNLIAMSNSSRDTSSNRDIYPTLRQLGGRFHAMCMEDSWVTKNGGCSGLRVMTEIPGPAARWIYERVQDNSRIMIHMLKDLPFDLPNEIEDVTEVLTTILRVSHTFQETQSEIGATTRCKLFQALIGIFFPELASSTATVRHLAQKCITLLMEISGRPNTDLLEHRDKLLSMIYQKPLRALPFPMQIGMIEAVRYCLSMDPPLTELNDELLRLLHETLGLADADDLGLLGRGNPRQGGIEVSKLRVACIKLLTASMPMADFFSKQQQTRQRVTGVYFKSLYSPSSEVKEVAHEGLKMVLTHQSRLPKELLQTGLRPILMNLADPKRLSVAGLEGLARLLGLLTNYFKVEIGHKLLDHFRSVSDPQMLQAPSRLPLAESDVVVKLVRLANIFHLLPSSANIFLDDLVNAVVQTEAHMLFSCRNPFSVPLGKYLDRYSSESLEFFLRHLQLPRHLRTLRSILQAQLAPNLQRELEARTAFIVNHFTRGTDPLLASHSVLLLHDLSHLSDTWLAENGFVVDALQELWRSGSPEIEQAPMLTPENRQSVILSIFTKALELTPRIDLLFEIVLAYSRNLSMDLVRTTHFLYRHVALSHDFIFRRNVLMRFLTWFEEPSHSWLHKAYLIRLVITPTLLVHANRSSKREGLVDVDFVSHIHRTIWQPMTNDKFAGTDDMLKIELLYLTTVLVHHYSWLLEGVKKDIIKCAWHYITSDDVIVKQTAYLLAARFFEAFDTPQKFILRAWTGLLRPLHSEGRNLTRQALEILAPTLLRSNMNEPGYPQWAKTIRRLLAEEGNGLPQIMIIYHIIIRQPQLFFPVRGLFVPHMVNTLSKLGLSGTSTNETRLLSIDALQVIFDWEQQALKQDPRRSKDPGQSGATWVTPIVYRESMVSYLVRLATAPHEQPARSTTVPRVLALLQQMIGQNGWNDVTVKLNYFSKALEQNEMNSEPLLASALSSARVLQIIAADKSDSWYTTNALILQRLIRKGITSEENGLQDALHPIFDRLSQLFPLPKEEDDQQNDMTEFHKFVYTAVGDGLRNSTSLRGTLLMLKTVVQVSPERVEPFSASLMRLLSKLAKEHLLSTPNSNTFDAGVRILISILDISQISVTFLGDQRRWLLSALVALVEKSKSLVLCRYTLDLARSWALHKHDAYPTMKEKASLLQKMLAFEMRGDPLFHNYLELIYEIYTDTGLRRSDLTTRLEQPFLVGCRARDDTLRERFVDLLDSSIPRSLPSRISYILGVQNWEALADHNWIHLAIHLLLGAADIEAPISPERKGTTGSANVFPPRLKVYSLIRPTQRLAFLDPQTAHKTWISIFPAAWACLSRREQFDTTYHMIALLSKDYHIKQAELRPNIIQTLLTGVFACSPPMMLPPHLLKYLAKTYGAWHIALELLGASLDSSRDDDISIRDAVYDSLADVYADLAEEDIFYGLWRRRCLFPETNAAIAFEQNAMWEQALNVYESAQNRTRMGSIPFSEAEYCLWEDHWILSAEKLQQWDTLYELAKNEGNQELMLESAWRTKDWAENRESLEEQINLLPEVATPRRRVFEAFIALLKLPGALDKNVEFTKILEDAMQLSLRKWVGLPPQLSAAHVPLLQHFQQFVELQEAVQIFGSLSTTNAQNLEKKSSDLKMVLQAWRERLPNVQDDISIWSDLVAWRQNVFNAINQAYIPLISNNPPAGGAGNTNTFGYRGYHETAWIINRFAHVARKHDLLDVCFSSLNKIYTLPNIEITEAFLKLREQARCHYQKPNDLQAGLEVINNTNLVYFSLSQKAEFYTLKGMFHARLGRMEEANQSFGQAVQMDMTQAKAWAEWGRFNDRMFKEVPNDLSHASNAVSCYLQAAGQYKNGKSRPLLARVLWLLSIDDNSFTISRAFDTYKGEAVFWYWITLIPQLLSSISQREVKQARYILLKLARLYPQALFFHLRTTKDEMALMKKQTAVRNALSAANPQAVADPAKRLDQDHSMTRESDTTKKEALAGETPGQSLVSQTATPSSPQHNPDSLGTEAVQRLAPTQSSGENSSSYPIRQPSEYIDEISQILKTASPLLIMSMETMVESIIHKFKGSAEEETYKVVTMLLNDALQHYVLRTNISDDDGQLTHHTINNIIRFSHNLSGQQKKDYEEDFMKNKPTHSEYMRRLMRWRDKYERYLGCRARWQSLDLLTPFLVEFQYGRCDDIEIPGQYTEDKDSNQNFIRIHKFGAKYESTRRYGNWRQIIMYGNDNSKTTFSVQISAARHHRREEKTIQIFRTFNGALGRKKETRKRNLHFHLPVIVSCSGSLRFLETDSSYTSFNDVYERHCNDNNMSREHPIFTSGDKGKKVLQEYKQAHGKTPTKMEFLALKKEASDEVMFKLIPEDVLTRYMTRMMEGPDELWRMRKQFGLQIASTSFMTYVFCLTGRTPLRFHFSSAMGLIAMSELVPGISNHTPIFAANDAVPFRFTPNMQHFLGPILTEGLLTCGILAIGRSLTEPEFDLEQQLCLFARDEVLFWLMGRPKPWNGDMARTSVAANIDGVVKRAEAMACKLEREQAIQNPGSLNNTPVVQSVTNLISTATNPLQLAKMAEIYIPWF